MGIGREAAGEDTGGEGRVSFGEEREEDQGMSKMKLKIMAKAKIPTMFEPNKRLVNHFRKFPDYFRMFPERIDAK